MKTITLILSLFFLSAGNSAFSQEEINEKNCHSGDIIFIKNNQFTGQHSAAEKTKYNYAGIIFFENEYPVVYFASEPLKKCALSDFIKLSEGKKFHIKRLIDESLLSLETISTMKTYAEANLGTAYDNREELNTEAFYNAEFIWKIYKSCLGIHLCEPKDFSMASTGPRSHFGASQHTLANKYIGIRDLYHSASLE